MQKLPVKIFITLTFIVTFFCGSFFVAQAQNQDTSPTSVLEKAKVTNIINAYEQEVIDTVFTVQVVEATVLTGSASGQTITAETGVQTLRIGDRFYFDQNLYANSTDYVVVEVVRHRALILLLLVFIVAVVWFARWQGVRSLVALAASFAAVLLVLLPGILNGWNPLLASVSVAAVVLFAAIFFTHGFNRESGVAFAGTLSAVIITSVFAIVATKITKLTGFAAEEAIYLNFNTGGTINFTALLLGSFIIGFLGVLDDIAITQAAVVTELYDSNKNISGKEVYQRAMRVGRQHVGALVNTLILAYTGAALPLLLYFKSATHNIGYTLSLEVFSTEIVRIIVGSIGLILTVPLVTLLAVKYLRNYDPKNGHHEHACHKGHAH